MKRGQYQQKSEMFIPQDKHGMPTSNAKFMRNLPPGIMMNQKALKAVSIVLLMMILALSFIIFA